MTVKLHESPLYVPPATYAKKTAIGKGEQIMQGLLLSQYQNSPLMQEYFRAFVSEMDLLFEQIEEVYLGRFIEYAVGRQLDVIGIILQQPRSVILPTQWFGLSDDGTPPPNVAGMANESAPAFGGIFRDENEGTGEVTPLTDMYYRRLLLVKAMVLNRGAATLGLAYYAILILLNRVPKGLEIRDSESLGEPALQARAVEVVLSSQDAALSEISLISYASKYFVPVGTTFNIRTTND